MANTKQKSKTQAALGQLKAKPKMIPDVRETIQASIPIRSVHDKYNLIEPYRTLLLHLLSV